MKIVLTTKMHRNAYGKRCKKRRFPSCTGATREPPLFCTFLRYTHLFVLCFVLFLSGVIYEPISNQSRSMKTIYNSWKIIQIQSSSRQVIEFWSSAAEAAACESLYYHILSYIILDICYRVIEFWSSAAEAAARKLL